MRPYHEGSGDGQQHRSVKKIKKMGLDEKIFVKIFACQKKCLNLHSF